MISNGIIKSESESVHVHKSTTYRIGLKGGLTFFLTVDPNGFTDVSVEWANGEGMDSFSELVLTAEDLHKVAGLFSFVAGEVNA